MIWPGGADHPPGRLQYVGPRIIVVWAAAARTVITVKLRTSTPYEHGVHDLFHLSDEVLSA